MLHKQESTNLINAKSAEHFQEKPEKPLYQQRDNMENEIKKVSNTYEIKTLKEVKMSKKVVDRITKLNKQQMNVLFWELVADKTRNVSSIFTDSRKSRLDFNCKSFL